MAESTNTRAAERYPVKAAVSFREMDDSRARIQSGLTADLNFLGLSLFSSTVLETGSRLRLWLLNAKSSELTRFDGNVVWSRIDDVYGDSPYWVQAGISFTELSEAQREALTKLLPEEAAKQETKRQRKHILAILTE